MKHIQKNKKIAHSSLGFTLVEVMIAISILSLAIVAAFGAVSNNLKGTNFSQDQITASYLADEGIEVIRNLRDQNGILNIKGLTTGGSAVPWLSGIANAPGDPCYSTACIVDSPHIAPVQVLTACSGTTISTCPYISRDPVSGLFGYTSSWVTTQFRRSVIITSVSSTEVKVSVTVSWITNGISKDYVLVETMRAWQ